MIKRLKKQNGVTLVALILVILFVSIISIYLIIKSGIFSKNENKMDVGIDTFNEIYEDELEIGQVDEQNIQMEENSQIDEEVREENIGLENEPEIQIEVKTEEQLVSQKESQSQPVCELNTEIENNTQIQVSKTIEPIEQTQINRNVQPEAQNNLNKEQEIILQDNSNQEVAIIPQDNFNQEVEIISQENLNHEEELKVAKEEENVKLDTEVEKNPIINFFRRIRNRVASNSNTEESQTNNYVYEETSSVPLLSENPLGLDVSPIQTESNLQLSGETLRTFEFSDNGNVLKNEGVGLAPWASNDYTLNMDTSLVYIGLSWAEWEPQEGNFNITEFERKNHIAEYKSQGRKAVFRFYMDYPSDDSHMDIPQWLYNKINQEGDWYSTSYGEGFSPNYANAQLIKYHRIAIEKLAQLYGNDDFFLYIQIGSLGHWGEYHVNIGEGLSILPSLDVRKQYVEAYTDNFKNATFLMRNSVPETVMYGTGLYNDTTGDREETQYWFDCMTGKDKWDQRSDEKLANNVDTWKIRPIGGEFASSHDNSYFIKSNVNETIELIKESHQSFLGPKTIVDDQKNYEKYKTEVQSILRNMGYRVYAKKAILNKDGNQYQIGLTMVNSGNAPIYQKNTQLVISIFDEAGNLVSKSSAANNFDIKSILPGEEKSTVVNIGELQSGKYIICIEMDRNGSASIQMPMDEYANRIYKIGEIQV